MNAQKEESWREAQRRCRLSDEEVRMAVEAINLSIEDLPEDVHVAVHVCQGNYAVGPHYDGQIGHRYFDTGRYKADLICQIECNSYLIEHDRTDSFEGVLGNKQLGVGAVDVQAPNVETAEQIAKRISVHRWLAPEQTIVTSTCEHLRVQSSVPPRRVRKNAGDDRSKGNSQRRVALDLHE